MQVSIGGIPVTVIRKSIKGMHLSVRAPKGEVRLSVPKRMSSALIESFLREKYAWIVAQRERILALPQAQELQYTTGESIPVWGRSYPLTVTHEGKRNHIRWEEDRLLLNLRADSTKEQREAYLNEWYRAQLKEQVTALLPKWERITGFAANEWQTKNMTTRWGTCNPKAKRIWFSIHLAKKPLACLEYVILHELAHLRVPNHGKEFTAILDRFMPDWKERKARLNQQD